MWSREWMRDGRVVRSRGVLAHQRRRDSLDGDGRTDDDLEVAEPADDGIRQARPRGHEEDRYSPCLERNGEAKESVQERFARGGVKGDGVAGEASGGGR